MSYSRGLPDVNQHHKRPSHHEESLPMWSSATMETVVDFSGGRVEGDRQHYEKHPSLLLLHSRVTSAHV